MIEQQSSRMHVEICIRQQLKSNTQHVLAARGFLLSKGENCQQMIFQLLSSSGSEPSATSDASAHDALLAVSARGHFFRYDLQEARHVSELVPGVDLCSRANEPPSNYIYFFLSDAAAPCRCSRFFSCL